MKIFVGADHRGFRLKKNIASFLTKAGHEVVDLGTHREGVACDYPKIAFKVAEQVAATRGARGILICMTGIGHSIAANKVAGAYAALCYNKEAAALSRQHNDANILVLGAKFVARGELYAIVETWLTAEFEGGRHARRTGQIKRREKQVFSDLSTRGNKRG